MIVVLMPCLFLCNICARAELRKQERARKLCSATLGNFFRCVRARANLRALMTRKSCAVGMRNAILRNHLKCRGTRDKAKNVCLGGYPSK